MSTLTYPARVVLSEGTGMIVESWQDVDDLVESIAIEEGRVDDVTGLDLPAYDLRAEDELTEWEIALIDRQIDEAILLLSSPTLSAFDRARRYEGRTFAEDLAHYLRNAR